MIELEKRLYTVIAWILVVIGALEVGGILIIATPLIRIRELIPNTILGWIIIVMGIVAAFGPALTLWINRNGIVMKNPKKWSMIVLTLVIVIDVLAGIFLVGPASIVNSNFLLYCWAVLIIIGGACYIVVADWMLKQQV